MRRSLLLASGLLCTASRRLPPQLLHLPAGGVAPAVGARCLAVPPVRRCPQEILRTCALEQAGDNMPILSVNTELDFSLPYRVLAFYAIAPVAAPDDAVAEHRQYLVKHDMVGRVYICADGLNAQVSGTTASCEAYRAFAAAAFPGIQLLFKEDPVAEPAFPKLRVKHKALVPGEAVDLNARGEDLEPERWAAMIAQGDGIGAPQPTILDVRNGYEWDVGHFEGAERPTLDEFAEFDAAAYGLPTDPEAKKSTPVMMYCTGGIRCEYFSAKLKAEGFEKVYKLQGGVQHYGNTMAARGGSARVQEEVQAAAAAAAAAEQVAEHGPPSSASSSSGSTRERAAGAALQLAAAHMEDSAEAAALAEAAGGGSAANSSASCLSSLQLSEAATGRLLHDIVRTLYASPFPHFCKELPLDMQAAAAAASRRAVPQLPPGAAGSPTAGLLLLGSSGGAAALEQAEAAAASWDMELGLRLVGRGAGLSSSAAASSSASASAPPSAPPSSSEPFASEQSTLVRLLTRVLRASVAGEEQGGGGEGGSAGTGWTPSRSLTAQLARAQLDLLGPAGGAEAAAALQRSQQSVTGRTLPIREGARHRTRGAHR